MAGRSPTDCSALSTDCAIISLVGRDLVSALLQFQLHLDQPDLQCLDHALQGCHLRDELVSLGVLIFPGGELHLQVSSEVVLIASIYF